MAKKKSVKIVVQAPKAVKQGGKNKRNPRASNGAQASGNRRSAIESSMPRPFKNIRSTGEIVVVSGMELISLVASASGPKTGQFLLNPGNSQYFKSLASTAFSYEKYRFRRLRLRYWTQAPSNRSGVISGVIVLDPLAKPPGDPQAYMAYSHSLTRPLSLDGASVPHRIVDQKWYFVNLDDTTHNATDPTTRYQGLVAWQSQGAASADADLSSGYLGLEYECEFTGHRPMRNITFTSVAEAADLKTGTNVNVSWLKIPNVVGSYDCQVATDEAGGDQKEGYAPGVTLSNSLLTYLGQHAINYLFPLGAATVDGKQVEPEKGFIPRPCVSLYRTRSRGPWTCEVGGAIVDTIPAWVTVLHRDADHEEKNGELVHPVQVKSLRAEHNYLLKGNAAGDVTVAIDCYKPGADYAHRETIDSNVVSSGTGALSIRRSVLYTEAQRNCRIVPSISPTGTETRVLSASNVFNYTEVEGDDAIL